MGILPILKRPTPVLDWLKERKTIILKEPIAKKLDPPEVKRVKLDAVRELTLDELTRLIEMSEWATKLAKGLAERGGIKPETDEWKMFTARLRRAVARGFAESIWARM